MLSIDQAPREQRDLVDPAEDSGARRAAGGPLRVLRFAGHLLAMVVAMLVGMAALGWAWHALLAATGAAALLRGPEPVILEMGVTAALGVGAWMCLNGRGRTRAVEMGAAVMAPAVAVLVPMWLGLISSGTALLVEHVAMVLAVLAVMLRRRQDYVVPRPGGSTALGRFARRRSVRRIGAVGVVLAAVAALPAGWLAVNAGGYEADRYAPTPVTTAVTQALATAAAPPHVPGRPTAVVVVGNGGANVADALAPYDVLSATGAFNVYLVAPERRPVPLLGGLDVIPDLSFAELRERLGGVAPDVAVVPEMPTDVATDRPVTAWLREVSGKSLVLGVCTGARLLADAGLLDGRDATSHWYRLAALQKAHTDVRWQRGVRYVDDGDVITTGGLLSSVDGTLRVVERLLGADAAAAAARTVTWDHYSPGAAAALPESALTPAEALLHVINTGFRANTTTVGVLLADGVSEIELAAAFDPYTEIKAGRTLAVAAGGTSIRSLHGLTFVPRAAADPGTAADLDWLVVPGRNVAPAARDLDLPVTFLHQQPGFAFDEPMRDMARRMDVPTAAWAAKVLELPTGGVVLAGPSWPWLPTLQALGLGLIGGVAALGALRLVRRVRGRRT